MGDHREKFATQMDAALLADLRELARNEGRQIQVLLEEAVTKLLNERDSGDARTRAESLHEAAIEKYSSVFETLAK